MPLRVTAFCHKGCRSWQNKSLLHPELPSSTAVAVPCVGGALDALSPEAPKLRAGPWGWVQRLPHCSEPCSVPVPQGKKSTKKLPPQSAEPTRKPGQKEKRGRPEEKPRARSAGACPSPGRLCSAPGRSLLREPRPGFSHPRPGVPLRGDGAPRAHWAVSSETGDWGLPEALACSRWRPVTALSPCVPRVPHRAVLRPQGHGASGRPCASTVASSPPL